MDSLCIPDRGLIPIGVLSLVKWPLRSLALMRREGFDRLGEALEEFRIRFNDEFLRSPVGNGHEPIDCRDLLPIPLQ